MESPYYTPVYHHEEDGKPIYQTSGDSDNSKIIYGVIFITMLVTIIFYVICN